MGLASHGVAGPASLVVPPPPGRGARRLAGPDLDVLTRVHGGCLVVVAAAVLLNPRRWSCARSLGSSSTRPYRLPSPRKDTVFSLSAWLLLHAALPGRVGESHVRRPDRGMRRRPARVRLFAHVLAQPLLTYWRVAASAILLLAKRPLAVPLWHRSRVGIERSSPKCARSVRTHIARSRAWALQACASPGPSRARGSEAAGPALAPRRSTLGWDSTRAAGGVPVFSHDAL